MKGERDVHVCSVFNTSRGRISSLVAVSMLLLGAAVGCDSTGPDSNPSSGGCEDDSDCETGRYCHSGYCALKTGNSPSYTPEEKGCSDDGDCYYDLLCDTSFQRPFHQWPWGRISVTLIDE